VPWVSADDFAGVGIRLADTAFTGSVGSVSGRDAVKAAVESEQAMSPELESIHNTRRARPVG